jgi:hypothetical protein
MRWGAKGEKREQIRAIGTQLSAQEEAVLHTRVLGFKQSLALLLLSSVVAHVSRCRCSSASHPIPYRRSPLSPGIITITIICCQCGVGKRAMPEEECKEMANHNKMQ